MLLGLFAASASAGTVTARPADSFVDSVGVNVHLGYTQSPYNNFSAVDSALQNLGVRYVRDGIGLGGGWVYARYRTLAEQGIKLNFVVGDPLQRWGTGTVDQQLDMIAREFPNAVATLEAPNEFDISGDPNWIVDLKSYMKRMYEGIKARPALAQKPIVGPSLVRAESRSLLGNVTGWTDMGNMHPYPGGEMADADNHQLSELSLVSKVSGTQPVQVTETGYNNAVNTSDGFRPASEKAAGIYMPRLFLDNFRRGIVRSFSYELLDESNDTSRTDVEQNFGLLHSDFSPKPAYTAMQRTIRLLEDRGPAFTPGSFGYSISGAPASQRSVLLQKRDGSFYLVLWNAVSVWNSTNCTELNPASPNVTVNFGQTVEKTEVFRPNESSSAVASGSKGSSVSLPLTPGISIIRIVPGGGSEPVPLPEPTPAPEPAPEAPTTTPVSAPEALPSPAPVAQPPAPAPVAAPVSKPTAESPAGAPTVPSGEKPKSAKKPKVNRGKIVHSVRGGCRRGCPLRGSELAKARALLAATVAPGSASARVSATSDSGNERLAGWLAERASSLAASGPLSGQRALRYTTIQIVLEVVGEPLPASAAASVQ